MEAPRVDELLRGMASVRALVIGDLMLDRYLTGTVERVSPEAPVPVVKVQSERTAIGGAGNVAANVRSLGAACALVACVGQDPEGGALLAALEESGVRCDGVRTERDRPTTVKTRVLAQRQQVVRFDREVDDAAPPVLATALARRVRAGAESCDVIIAQDYDKGVLGAEVIAAVRASASMADVPWVVDPKRRNFFAYAGATVFKPNSRELGDALGTRVCADDERWMEEARQRVNCDHLLLTMGDRGMAMQSRGAHLVRLPAVARDVYDVSGAGDTVTAVVALALAAGASIGEAAVLANHAAAVEVGKSGVHTVSPDEIRAQASSIQAVNERSTAYEERP